MARKSDIFRKLDELAAQEREFLTTRVIAPVLRGRKVQVRIAGVRCELAVRPADFEGVGIFEPTSHSTCRLERPATLVERRRYLSVLPAVRLVLVDRSGSRGLGVLASQTDARFRIDGAAPVHLVDEADRFDTVVARFDGARFWLDELDPRAEPAAARYLRESILVDRPVAALDRPGLTAEQRSAYAMFVDARRREAEALAEAQRRADELVRERAEAARQREAAARRSSTQGRLAEALEHSGAALRDFVEQHGQYRVTFNLDGRNHVSVVARDDLRVLSSGICLSGEDEKFDLASLVGVLREGAEQW